MPAATPTAPYAARTGEAQVLQQLGASVQEQVQLLRERYLHALSGAHTASPEHVHGDARNGGGSGGDQNGGAGDTKGGIGKEASRDVSAGAGHGSGSAVDRGGTQEAGGLFSHYEMARRSPMHYYHYCNHYYYYFFYYY